MAHREPTQAEKYITQLADVMRGLSAANVEIICAIEELGVTAFNRGHCDRPTAETVIARISKALEMNTDFTTGAARVLQHMASKVEKGETKW